MADNIFDHACRGVDYRTLPRVTFTSPVIALAGMTDAEATAKGFACARGVLAHEHAPRSLANRDIQGVVQLGVERTTGRLLGAYIAAEGEGDVIAVTVYALENERTLDQMANLRVPYLTMADALKLAARITRDVSKLSCARPDANRTSPC